MEGGIAVMVHDDDDAGQGPPPRTFPVFFVQGEEPIIPFFDFDDTN
jgi:hypothetical protein